MGGMLGAMEAHHMSDIGGGQLFEMAGNMSGDHFMVMDSNSAFGMFEARGF
ncbi:MAG: hypothetical protein CM1200mP22_16270 [Dehalococcoidia bacterium]|nr:MAG: hypothetical protein CM1200mP22_16270 [Dehalococcoidia bacterium]